RRPLTAPAKIQTALDVSQKCSHTYKPLANKSLPFRSAQAACHRKPKAILPVLRLFRFSQPNKDCFTGCYGTGSGCDGYVLEIFGHVGFSLSEANFVFHTQHESSVQIPVCLDP